MGYSGVPVFGDVVGEVGDGVRPPLLLERAAVGFRAPVEADRVELADPLRGQCRYLASSIGAAWTHPRSESASVLALPAWRHVEVPVLVPEPVQALDIGCPLVCKVVDRSAGPGRGLVEPEVVELRDPLRGEPVGAETTVLAAVHHPRAQPHPVLAHECPRGTGVPVVGDESHEVRDAGGPQLGRRPFEDNATSDHLMATTRSRAPACKGCYPGDGLPSRTVAVRRFIPQ